MMNWYIWIVAALAYVIFAAWYFNWKGSLKPNEIEQYIMQVQENSGGSPTDPEVLRKFMESDDGKDCLLYTSPSPRDQRGSRMPSSA